VKRATIATRPRSQRGRDSGNIEVLVQKGDFSKIMKAEVFPHEEGERRGAAPLLQIEKKEEKRKNLEKTGYFVFFAPKGKNYG